MPFLDTLEELVDVAFEKTKTLVLREMYAHWKIWEARYEDVNITFGNVVRI